MTADPLRSDGGTASRRHVVGCGARRACVLIAVAAFAACKGDATQPTGNFTISPPTHTMNVGATIQLSAIDAPGAVTWASNRETVATVVPETGFVTGTGSGTATISAVSGSAVAIAEITVRVPATIVLDQSLVVLQTLQGAGAPAAATVQITNGGDVDLGTINVGPVQYGAGEPTGWLNLALNTPNAPANLTLNASVDGLAPGTYTASVAITAAAAINSPQSLAVQLRILTPPSIQVSRSSVSLPAIPGQVVTDVVEVTNGGTAPLADLVAEIAYQGQSGWLQASLSATTPPAELALQATSGTLEVGTYNATVTLRSTSDASVTPRTVNVALVVSPGPAIRLTPPTASLNATPGGGAVQTTVQVTNSGGGSLTGLGLGTIQYGAGGAGWLNATINSTTAPATITLIANPGSLAEGVYTATVPVNSPVASNSPNDLDVTLTVGPPPTIAVNPTSVTFGSFVGAPANFDPGPQVVTITNSGGGVLTGLTADIQEPGADTWLDIQWITPQTAPAQLRLSASTGSLARGTYTATVTISAPGSGSPPKTVNVTFNVSSFAVDVSPIFSANYSATTGLDRCINCHAAMGSTPSSRYSWASGYVNPGNPSGSLLYCKIIGNIGTGSGQCSGSAMPLPQAEINLIQNWILRGAPFQ